jgi:homoserine O-succinyltransferase
MPIKIPNDLPAREVLLKEGVSVMREGRAAIQQIRPLRLALLNLMPNKVRTETQIARLIGSTPLQIELTLLTTETYKATNTAEEHLFEFYQHWSDVKDEKFDGLVITGAPIGSMAFEDIAYWDEMKQIFDWSQTNVFSTLTLCWGAMAALHYFHGVRRTHFDDKVFGVYPYKTVQQQHGLLRGFDDVYEMPVSRHSGVLVEEIEKVPSLHLMAHSDEVGAGLIVDSDLHMTYMLNHLEYDFDDLSNEYKRDLEAGKPIEMPVNYYPNDDLSQKPLNKWRASAHLFFTNWIDEMYQYTPYDISRIPNPTQRLDID